eukprot:GGOE01013978.1.p2 GENE.GGOE01013978.1~~GGOE01013978.1.p2  ORF type:complete len:189 (-),score=36.55 GGOE01013978.1:187-753(-)
MQARGGDGELGVPKEPQRLTKEALASAPYSTAYRNHCRRLSGSSDGTEAEEAQPALVGEEEEESAAQRALENILASRNPNKYDFLASWGPDGASAGELQALRQSRKPEPDQAMAEELLLADIVVLHQLPPPCDDGSLGMQVVRAHYKGCVSCHTVQPVGAFVPGKLLCLKCHHMIKWRRWTIGADDAA